jgi:hypothetical protein
MQLRDRKKHLEQGDLDTPIFDRHYSTRTGFFLLLQRTAFTANTHKRILGAAKLTRRDYGPLFKRICLPGAVMLA